MITRKSLAPAYNFGPTDDSKLNVEEMANVACSIWEGNVGYIIERDQKKVYESNLLWLSSELALHDLGWKNSLSAVSSIRWTINWEKESNKTDAKTALDLQINEFFRGDE